MIMPSMVIGSLRGSPGATTLAAGLTALWPEPDRVLVEADPAGGVLAADWRLRVRPGLVDVAASISGETEDPGSALEKGTQRADFLGESLSVVCAPAAPIQARAAAGRVCDSETGVLLPQDRWVITDLGRLAPDAPTWPLLARADAVCVLVSGTVAQMMALRGMTDLLWSQAGSRLFIAVAPATYSADEVNGLLITHGSLLHVLGDVPRLPAGSARRRRTLARAWRDFTGTMFDAATREPMLAIEAAPEVEEIEEAVL